LFSLISSLFVTCVFGLVLTLISAYWTLEYIQAGKSGSSEPLSQFGPLAVKVSTTVLKYELKEEDLIPGTRGIINQLVKETASITFRYGILLVYLEHEEIA